MQHREPLDGVTVITHTRQAADPLYAARLKSMGASVIKVEPPVGDPLEAATTANYGELTAGQDIRKVDLKSEGGLKEAPTLSRQADIPAPLPATCAHAPSACPNS